VALTPDPFITSLYATIKCFYGFLTRFFKLETELNNALLALSERELSRIEAIRDMEYKFQEQAQILSGFRKGDLSALKAAKMTAPEMSATTPESGIYANFGLIFCCYFAFFRTPPNNRDLEEEHETA
jgi:hypothetical protein